MACLLLTMVKRLDLMMWITLAITGFVFSLHRSSLFGSAISNQYTAKRTAFITPIIIKLELLWTVVPAIFLHRSVALDFFTGLESRRKLQKVHRLLK
jgi:cytochrome c oxidase subunit 2